MNNKQILIKGFEIGLNNKNSVHTQLQLAEIMANLNEDTQGLCYNCEYGNIGLCAFTPKEGEAYATHTYESVGMCSNVIICDKFKERK